MQYKSLIERCGLNTLQHIIYGGLLIILAIVSPAQTLRIEALTSNGKLSYQECSTALQYRVESALKPNGPWSNLWVELDPTPVGSNAVIVSMSESVAFYRIVGDLPMTDMAFIRAGRYAMGDMLGDGDFNERPVHTNQLGAYFIEVNEISGAMWDEVRNWALTNGYNDLEFVGYWKEPDHPVWNVSWYDAVKWCNARSERAGRVPVYRTDVSRANVYRSGKLDLEDGWVLWQANGYRLPTEAEWESAARGGLTGQRFPWGDAIDHDHANYYSTEENEYDSSYPPGGYNPAFANGNEPYTGPVMSLMTNRYGIHNMAGNVAEWCWDWYTNDYYAVSATIDPHGPAAGEPALEEPLGTGNACVLRGGNWADNASFSRVAFRCAWWSASKRANTVGFRTVVRAGAGNP